MNMGLDAEISHVIIENSGRILAASLSVDVAVVGGGPSGLVCAGRLGDEGLRVALFEKRLAPGGGIWGGGIGFSVLVLPEDLGPMLEEMGVDHEKQGRFIVADAVACGAALIAHAARHACVFNGFTCEDLLMRRGAVAGVVVNSSSIAAAGLHVDPISVEARVVVDATGHDAALVALAARHTNKRLVRGQGPMNAAAGEKFVVKRTGQVMPGLYVCGMAVNAVHGGARMGRIFGGMLKSGARCAEIIEEALQGSS